jgi:phage shock protein E
MRWLAIISIFLAVASASAQSIDNPAIDMAGYLRIAGEAAQHRQSRRVSEDDFIRMSREPGTIVLDARSREKYDELHIRGAVYLSFPDITMESLRRLIPDRTTRILIYCNNNFLNAEGPFPGKIARASLNLSTYIALFSYGYRNVYELGPLLDIRSTKLELEGTTRQATTGAPIPGADFTLAPITRSHSMIHNSPVSGMIAYRLTTPA